MKKIFLLFILLSSQLLFAYDNSDYETYYREARNTYLSRFNNFQLSHNALMQLHNIFTLSCYKIEGVDLTNYEGLLSGSCAEDNSAAQAVTGGVKRNGNSLGDKIATLINMSPFTTSNIDFHSKLVDASNVYDTQLATVPGSSAITITKIASCTPKKDYLTGKAAGTIDEMITAYKARYDAWKSAASQLQLAIPQYKAAKEGYQAAVTVYSTLIDCHNAFGANKMGLDFDPYVP